MATLLRIHQMAQHRPLTTIWLNTPYLKVKIYYVVEMPVHPQQHNCQVF